MIQGVHNRLVARGPEKALLRIPASPPRDQDSKRFAVSRPKDLLDDLIIVVNVRDASFWPKNGSECVQRPANSVLSICNDTEIDNGIRHS